MTQATEPEAQPRQPDTEEAPASLADRIRAIVSHGEEVFSAEIALQKARAGILASRGKRVAIGLVLGAVFGALLAIALVVGLLLALAPLITPWGALGVVGLALALMAALSLLVARHAFNEARDLLLGQRNATKDNLDTTGKEAGQ
jgi:hypothetical protein